MLTQHNLSKAVFRTTQVCTCGVTSLPRWSVLAMQSDLSAWKELSSSRDLLEKGWSVKKIVKTSWCNTYQHRQSGNTVPRSQWPSLRQIHSSTYISIPRNVWKKYAYERREKTSNHMHAGCTALTCVTHTNCKHCGKHVFSFCIHYTSTRSHNLCLRALRCYVKKKKPAQKISNFSFPNITTSSKKRGVFLSAQNSLWSTPISAAAGLSAKVTMSSNPFEFVGARQTSSGPLTYPRAYKIY